MEARHRRHVHRWRCGPPSTSVPQALLTDCVVSLASSEGCPPRLCITLWRTACIAVENVDGRGLHHAAHQTCKRHLWISKGSDACVASGTREAPTDRKGASRTHPPRRGCNACHGAGPRKEGVHDPHSLAATHDSAAARWHGALNQTARLVGDPAAPLRNSLNSVLRQVRAVAYSARFGSGPCRALRSRASANTSPFDLTNCERAGRRSPHGRRALHSDVDGAPMISSSSRHVSAMMSS